MVVFTVRPYKDSDLQELIKVYKSAFAEPPWNETWTSEEIIEDLEFAKSQKDPIVLVAEKDDGLTGFTWGYRLPLKKFPFLIGKVSDNVSYVDEISIRGNARRQGMGSLLVNGFQRIVNGQGIDEVVLRTDERNPASMALFKKLGYESFGVYDPKYPDRIYLRRKLK